VEFTADSL
jgi:zinc transporter ZupT